MLNTENLIAILEHKNLSLYEKAFLIEISSLKKIDCHNIYKVKIIKHFKLNFSKINKIKDILISKGYLDKRCCYDNNNQIEEIIFSIDFKTLKSGW